MRSYSSAVVSCRLFDANTGLRWGGDDDDDDDAALAEPLLTIPYAEDECGEEDGDDATEKTKNPKSSSCWDTDPDLISLLVLPLLLCLQFALALHYSSTTKVWEVGRDIGFFVIFSFLYKEGLKDAECEDDKEDHNPASGSGSNHHHHRSLLTRLPRIVQHVLHLLPEILVDVVLGLVLFGSVEAGARALLVSNLILILFVVAFTLRHGMMMLWTAAAGHEGTS